MSIQLTGVTKSFEIEKKRIEIISHLDLSIQSSKRIAIVGPSGSGKSTLLSLLSGLIVPDSGSVNIDQVEISTLNEDERAQWRRRNIGYIFQSFNLAEHLTALENVELSLEIAGSDLKNKATEMLKRVGLKERLFQFPHQMSGGEKQRVAIARALVSNPKLLLADEPTGSLDHDTGVIISNLLFELSREFNSTLIIVTHNLELAASCDQIFEFTHGGLRLKN